VPIEKTTRRQHHILHNLDILNGNNLKSHVALSPSKEKEDLNFIIPQGPTKYLNPFSNTEGLFSTFHANYGRQDGILPYSVTYRHVGWHSWICRPQVPPGQGKSSNKLHGVTYQNTVIFTVTAVSASNQKEILKITSRAQHMLLQW